MTFHLQFNNSFEKAEKKKTGGKYTIVGAYSKKPGGYGPGMQNKEYMKRELNRGKKDPSYKSPIDGYVRSNPEPTKNEAKQKSMNNKLAAEGKNYRVTISPNGKTKKVTVAQRQNDQMKKRGHKGTPGAAYGNMEKKGYSNERTKKLTTNDKKDIQKLNSSASKGTKRYLEMEINKRKLNKENTSKREADNYLRAKNKEKKVK